MRKIINQAIKKICDDEVKPITITIRGGVIQDISNIPSNILVCVHDYDIDNLTIEEREEETELDEDGNFCMVSIWKHQS